MESYRLVKKLGSSEDSNKYIAIKYDFGKVKSEKYGEAIISGHFLRLTRHGELCPENVEQLQEKANIWLNEMGLEQHYEDAFEKIYLQFALAFTAPGTDPNRQEFYFKTMLFTFIFDDAVAKQKRLNKNNPVKHGEDLIRIAERLNLIIQGCGDDISTAAAIDKLHPVFKTTCIVLSYVCRYSSGKMCKDDYERFAKELIDFIKSNKWMHEYRNSPYSQNEYLFLRSYDIGLRVTSVCVYFSKDIHISDEIRMHPLFQKYVENASIYETLTNDTVSVAKELANNEGENFVFLLCEKYALQRSIEKTQNMTNKMAIDLKKMGIKLKSYFPSDYNLAKYIEATELMLDGFLYWHLNAKRYGNFRYEEYEVEHDCDYNIWLEKICDNNVESLKEPALSDSVRVLSNSLFE